MPWQFWHRDRRPAHLGPELRRTVASRFGLRLAEVESLTCIERRGLYAGRPVKHLRIYDENLLNGSAKAVEAYEDLSSQPQAVLFEGHVEGDGSVDLLDKRTDRDASA